MNNQETQARMDTRNRTKGTNTRQRNT